MPDRNIWLFTAAALVVVMLFFQQKGSALGCFKRTDQSF